MLLLTTAMSSTLFWLRLQTLLLMCWYFLCQCHLWSFLPLWMLISSAWQSAWSHQTARSSFSCGGGLSIEYTDLQWRRRGPEVWTRFVDGVWEEATVLQNLAKKITKLLKSGALNWQGRWILLQMDCIVITAVDALNHLHRVDSIRITCA